MPDLDDAGLSGALPPALASSALALTGMDFIGLNITTPDPTWGLWQSRGYGDSSYSLTADVITLTIAARDGSTRGTLAGFQITLIPEPSSMALLALGSGALIVRRKRHAC